MEHYSNFWTFEIASLPNVLGHYLRKYGMYNFSNHLTPADELLRLLTLL